MIPRILAACPTLERYRTLSHNTLEELGLPRCPLRVINRHQAANARCPLFPQQRTCGERAAPDPFAITGITMISSDTATSQNCSPLRRHRHRFYRQERTRKRQGAAPMRWLLRRCPKHH
jgi:hypothetical protein